MSTASHIDVVSQAFLAVVNPRAELRLVASGMKFTEGPAWWGGRLVFSDIPNNVVYAWNGRVLSELRRPSHNANGHTIDGAGALIACEHGSRSVTRMDAGGTHVTLAATHGGKRLNSPNDVVVKSDGTIWFTDPPYGIKREQVEQDGNYVFRLPPGGGEPVVVADDLSMPNGLCFSPDESVLYVADSDPARREIKRYAVMPDGRLEKAGLLATISPGVPDGIRCDAAGRVFSTAGDGVQVFGRDGALIGKIRTPAPVSNCCFGGAQEQGRTLFITARDSVWAIDLLPAVGSAPTGSAG